MTWLVPLLAGLGGLFMGAAIGVFVMALMVAASRRDRL